MIELMRLAGEFVVFHLSPEGRQALGTVFPDRESIPAFVIDEDQYGVWIWKWADEIEKLAQGSRSDVQSISVVLLRKEYFSTISAQRDPDVVAHMLR